MEAREPRIAEATISPINASQYSRIPDWMIINIHIRLLPVFGVLMAPVKFNPAQGDSA
jgi:hypothetical protein